MSTNELKSISRHQAGIEAFELASQYVNDIFTVRVSLPASYEMTDKTYPVLYVLDGEYSFGLATTTMTYINVGINFGMGKNIPEMIVVGIGYEHGVFPWLLTRVRDFSPTVDPTFNYDNPNIQIPASGGAEKFYQLFHDEIIPMLAARYRIDPALSVLATHSMGGLWGLFTLFHARQVFNKYLFACPFVGWDKGAIFKTEEAYAKNHTELKADTFFAVTGQEPTPNYINEVHSIYDVLKKRNYKNFRVDLAVYPDDNHFSVWPKAFIDGLVSLFKE